MAKMKNNLIMCQFHQPTCCWKQVRRGACLPYYVQALGGRDWWRQGMGKHLGRNMERPEVGSWWCKNSTAVPGIKLFLQVMVTLLYQGKKWWADLTCSGRHVGRWALEGRPGQPGGRLGRNLIDFLKMWGQVLNYEMARYHCPKKLTLNDMNLRK